MTETAQMIVVEGLEMPDLRPYFKHLHWRPMPHSFGVPVASDFADYPEDHEIFGLYKKCGLWTQAEAAILYNTAQHFPGVWVDLGAHSGWTTSHIHKADPDGVVGAVDPMFAVLEFWRRFIANMQSATNWEVNSSWRNLILSYPVTANEFFQKGGIALADGNSAKLDGICIDGDHSEGKPLEDAKNAFRHLNERGAVIFHDAIGKPVQDAVIWLWERGFTVKVYTTPHVVALCWRGQFEPPAHHANRRIAECVRPHLGDISKFL